MRTSPDFPSTDLCTKCGVLAAKREAVTGWSAEAFEAAWEKQAGLCAICSVPMIKGGQRVNSVCADHDHETGLPRDLICRTCNVGLGVYEKRGTLFANYLARFRAYQ